MAAKKAEHTVTILCRCLQVTRSGFYAWCRHPLSRRARKNQAVLVQIRHWHHESDGSYGSPRMHRDLRRRDFPGSVDSGWRG